MAGAEHSGSGPARPPLTRRRREARAAAMVAAGLVAANAVVGAGIAVAFYGDPQPAAAVGALDPAPPPPLHRPHSSAEVLRRATGLGTPEAAMAGGVMVFALSGFASALVLRLSRPGAERAGAGAGAGVGAPAARPEREPAAARPRRARG